MIIYLDKNKKPNVVCDGDSVLTDILEGENIVIERDLENKTITISSDARKNIMESIKAGENISVTCDKDKKTVTISSDARNDVFNSIKAGENVTITHDKTNKTITINSDAKNETMNSIRAGDNIVIMDDGSGGVTVNALLDILDKNPSNPKPGYMWILNNGDKNPGSTGGDTGSGEGGTGGNTGGGISVTDGTFACFDGYGNFYCSEDGGVSWQKRGKIECDSGVYPVAGIALGGGTMVSAAGSQLYYSSDGGSTWDRCTQSVYSYIRGIEYINGRFYACCGSATATTHAPSVLMVSNNGITWKTALQKYNTSRYAFEKIQYINNAYFLFAANMLGGGSRILYSANGSTWTDNDNNTYTLFPKIIYNGTVYIAAVNNTFEIYTSPDGKSWELSGGKIVKESPGSSSWMTDLEKIGEKFYAVISNKWDTSVFGRAISSYNGLEWGNIDAGDETTAITMDISNGFCRHNGRTYHLGSDGILKSSGGFAPWETTGTVPLEDPGNAPVSCFSILQQQPA